MQNQADMVVEANKHKRHGIILADVAYVANGGTMSAKSGRHGVVVTNGGSGDVWGCVRGQIFLFAGMWVVLELKQKLN